MYKSAELARKGKLFTLSNSLTPVRAMSIFLRDIIFSFKKKNKIAFPVAKAVSHGTNVHIVRIGKASFAEVKALTAIRHRTLEGVNPLEHSTRLARKKRRKKELKDGGRGQRKDATKRKKNVISH